MVHLSLAGRYHVGAKGLSTASTTVMAANRGYLDSRLFRAHIGWCWEPVPQMGRLPRSA